MDPYAIVAIADHARIVLVLWLHSAGGACAYSSNSRSEIREVFDNTEHRRAYVYYYPH